MKKYLFRLCHFQFISIVSLAIFFGFSVFSPITFAAGLVPCGNPGQAACTVCDFFKMADDIIDNTIKYIVPTVAAILMVVGAFFYMTAGGSESQIKKGHDIITSTVIGVVIVLLAWIIVDSVIKALTGKSELLSKPWSTIKCESAAPQEEKIGVMLPSPVVTPSAPTLTSTAAKDFSQLKCSPNCYYQKNPDLADKKSDGSNWTVAEKANLYTHDEALGKLKDQNINVYGSGGLCSDQNSSGCTSLNGMPKGTIDTLVDVKKNCNCDITVTGGTEAGHKSQGFGKSSIDLRYNEGLYSSLGSQSNVAVVREKGFNENGTCDAGWYCYSHVTAPHISFYVKGADLYK